VFESNLPDDLHQHYGEANVSAMYAIRTDLNPFYLRGDFDGDKKQDYALAIVERTTKKKGILIYHPTTKIHYIIAAGNMTGNGIGDDFKWMDAWKVYLDKQVERGVGEPHLISLKGEAILVIKLEASSGLIYWTGKEYRWYQQGD
jgi:hypothetical protein